VGLKELHLDPSQLGYLFTAMAIGSVAAAIGIMPLARARLSPNKLTFYANSLLVLDLFLMAIVNRPYAFLRSLHWVARVGHRRKPNFGSPGSAQCRIGRADA
jgi:hypothetical protein